MRISNLSERLGLFLETSGISQKELSKLSGVSDSIICRTIKGQNNLTTDNLVRIVDAINVDPAWLIGYGADEDMERM